MVTIYTSKVAKNKIEDVESRFELLIKTGEKFEDDIYTQVMQQIDGVISRDNEIIETKFGKTLINNLSTGCKSVILMIFYRDSNYFVNIDDCGDNAIKIVFSLGDSMNIKAFTASHIKINGDNITCMLNDHLCVGGYNIFKKSDSLTDNNEA